MSKVSYLIDLDLELNELQNFVVQNLAVAPSSTKSGRIYFNTGDNMLYYHNGTTWVSIATGGVLTDYQLKSEKGKANGYAGLDADGKIAAALIPDISGTYQLKLVQGDNITIDGTKISAKDTTYVDATQSAHGLMSTTDKKKLDSIAEGAEVNVQSDWTESDSGSDAFIKNKPTLGTASEKDAGTSSGNVPVLGTDGKLPTSILPAIAITEFLGVVTTKASLTTKTGQQGDWAIVSASTPTADDGMYIITTGTGSTASDWTKASSAVGGVVSINGQAGVVVLTAADVGAIPELETGPTAGTYPKVTIDTYGRATGGQSLVASDIPNLDTSKITTGTFAIARIPTGNAADKVPLLGGPLSAGQSIMWDSSAGKFMPYTPASGTMKKYTTTITGNGSTKSWTITHGLGTLPSAVQISDADGNIFIAETKISTTNVVINVNTAPASGTTWTVQVTG